MHVCLRCERPRRVSKMGVVGWKFNPRVLEEEQIATAIPLNDKATTKHDMVENTPEHKNAEAMVGDPTDKDSEPKEKKSKEILY
jgi:hypothetical protein